VLKLLDVVTNHNGIAKRGVGVVRVGGLVEVKGYGGGFLFT